MSLIWSNLAQTVLCIGLTILVFVFLEKPLRDLLDKLIGIPSATIFYTRVLALVLVLIAVKRSVLLIDRAGDAWTSVWTVMSNWNDVMEPLFISLLVFAGLMTVLIAVLRRAHEQ
jgi:hypothetical protein